MTVNDLGAGFVNSSRHAPDRGKIGEIRLPRDGKAANPERELRRELGKGALGHCRCRAAVRDQPDLMAALGLTRRQVDNVTKQAAHWRAQDMEASHGASPAGS